MPSVQFRVKCVTQHSEEVKVVGDRALTGFWDPAVSELGLRTDERAYPWWEGSCEVPEGERWELKFVASGPTGVRWEGCANRVLLPGGEAARYEARFDEPGATLTPLSGDMAVGSSQPAYRPPAVPEDSELLDDNGDEAGSPASPPAPAARTPIPRNPQRGLRSLTERNVRQLAASLERSEAQQASSSTDEPNQLTPRLQFPQAQMSRRTLSSSSFSGSVRGDAGVVQMVRLLSESMSPDVGPPDPEEPQEPDWNIGGERNGGSEEALSGDSDPALVLTSSRGASKPSTAAEEPALDGQSGSQTKAVAQNEQGGAPRKRRCADGCLCKLLSRICCCCGCSCLCGAKEAKRGERVSSEAARSGDSELAQVPTSPSTLDADKPPTAAEDATQSASGGEKGGTPRKRKCTDCCLCKLLSRICCCCCCSCLCGAKEAKRGERVSSGAARSGESKLAEVPTSSSTLDTSKPSTAAEEMSPEDPSKKNGDASGKRRCTDCCLCRLLSRACCCCCGVKGAKRS
eukprot:TRINITY_DN2541_c0_g1_i1.p1 TRINITY_DN2541_c0_g1~~TRINITY_DN2541_c0_g1_i1.p1  ORF type:complete len:543 (-),score=104.62 TRINITY_DN2541_c0_g1_i1:13-1560(-)